MWWLIVLAGCGGADPELTAQRRAVDAWRLGHAALKSGDPASARGHFKEAREARPTDVLLWVWEAEAARALGDRASAQGLLESAVQRSPALAEAHYNLAALYALDGDAASAAVSLKRSLDLDAARPEAVLDDPDFAGVLDHPSMAFLPRRELKLGWRGPEGSVFLGSQVPLTLVIDGAAGSLSVKGEVTGPVRLVRVMESRKDARVELEWTFQVLGAGTVGVGEIGVESGGMNATLQGVQVEALAPQGRGEPHDRLQPLTTVSERGEQRGQPSASWDPTGLWVRFGPTDQVALSPAGGEWTRYSYREDGQVQWSLIQILGLPEGEAMVEIAQGSGGAWSQPVVVGTEIGLGEAKPGGAG